MHVRKKKIASRHGRGIAAWGGGALPGPEGSGAEAELGRRGEAGPELGLASSRGASWAAARRCVHRNWAATGRCGWLVPGRRRRADGPGGLQMGLGGPAGGERRLEVGGCAVRDRKSVV